MDSPTFVSTKQVKQALKLWHKDNAAGAPLEGHPLYQAFRHEGQSVRQATNRLLLHTIKLLEGENVEQAKLLTTRFLDDVTMTAVSLRLNRAESSLYVLQRAGIEHLTQLLNSQGVAARASHFKTMAGRFPAANKGLVGVEAAQLSLGDCLRAPDAPWIVSLEGIGGIGKTALANNLVRHLSQRQLFHDIGWVSAEQTPFKVGHPLGHAPAPEPPALTVATLVYALAQQLLGEVVGRGSLGYAEIVAALQELLGQQPYLIVIDNLETIVDVQELLPTLRDLMRPTKFLLTSRESHYQEPDVYHFIVPELSEGDALRLVRQEARVRNLPHLAEASDDQLRPIYRVAGGNPLALRLVVGQSHAHELAAILDDLASAGGQAERLYSFIYQRAWNHLDERAREALLAMPLAAPTEGASFEKLLAVSGSEPRTLRLALEGLITQNLVDVRGSLAERRYSIHGLTRSFLQEVVAQWQ